MESNIKYKNFFLKSIISIICIILTLIITVIIVDPYFQYHKPLNFLQYKIYNERYQNAGIVKNFSYDGLIIGTSVTQNFKSSDMERLFNVNTAVKSPFSGATFKEINEALKIAFKNNKEIKTVVRSLEHNNILVDKDLYRYQNYPYYLYDNKLSNDINYLLNKDVIFNDVIENTIAYSFKNNKTTTFDDYANWSKTRKYGKEAVISKYYRFPMEDRKPSLTEEEKLVIKENVQQNLTSIALENQDTTFYYYYSPLSTLYLDRRNRTGVLAKDFEELLYITELILQVDNIKLFSFFDVYEYTEDYTYYSDTFHYREDMNTQLMERMYNNQNLITKDNYIQHFKQISEHFLNYNYDSLFK
ncbi:MAG: hypothetical protein ACRCZK_03725 [Oscillospiraceae bacterium]